MFLPRLEIKLYSSTFLMDIETLSGNEMRLVRDCNKFEHLNHCLVLTCSRWHRTNGDVSDLFLLPYSNGKCTGSAKAQGT